MSKSSKRNAENRNLEPESEEEEEDEEDLAFSRNYFLARELHNGSSKRKSKHNKLADVDLVSEEALKAATSEIQEKHAKEIASLLNSYKSLYPKWAYELRCGFGLLTYGFGSKKALLEDFASTTLTDYGVVVVNGYLPSVNVKEVAVVVAELLQDQLKTTQKRSAGNKSKVQQFSSKSMEDVFSFLNAAHPKESNCFVCIIVHNIDGPALRDFESQQFLARLACSSHVRIVTSIDNVNAPLLWDKKMVHKQFNWSWHHVPTFQSYKAEGMFHPLVLASGSAAQTIQTALIVLQCLNANARGVFKVLAEYQLANPKEEGLPIGTLWTKCREQFIVSSLQTLNSHLTEFKDHQLVKTRKHSDGQDCLYIPLAPEALEKLLQELNC